MELRPPPFPESLCHLCRHCRRIDGARSSFLLCEALPQKYPPQPVRSCPAFEPKA
jgi:hypothetical protein